MVTHIVMWNFDASLTEETKKQAAAEMKEKLEALKEIVPGVLSVKVITEPLVSSTNQVQWILIRIPTNFQSFIDTLSNIW